MGSLLKYTVRKAKIEQKGEYLLGNLCKMRADCFGGDADRLRKSVHVRRRRIMCISSIHVHERGICVARQNIRNAQRDCKGVNRKNRKNFKKHTPVAPHRRVGILDGQPGLRDQLQHVNLQTVPLVRIREMN